MRTLRSGWLSRAILVVLTIAAPFAQPTGVIAAPVFGDGFESGTLSAWSGGVRFGVQSQTVRSGAYAGEAASTGQSSIAWRSITPTADLSTQTSFHVIQRSTAAWLVGYRKSAGGVALLVGLDGKGRLIARNVGTKTAYRSSTVVPSGVWHRLDVHVAIGTAGAFEVSLDGTPVPGLSQSSNLGTDPIGRFDVGDPNSGRSYRVAFDDIALASDAGSEDDPALVGRWDPSFEIGVVGVHALVLHTGEVLLFYRTETAEHTAQLLDPATGRLTDVSPPVELQYNMFCSAHVVGADGEVFVVGGLRWGAPIGYGTELTAFFDPDTGAWGAGPSMAAPRWYPTVASLADGDALIVSGDAEPGVRVGLMERYDAGAGAITSMPTSATKSMISYPRMFGLPDGRLIRVGAEQRSMFFDPQTSNWNEGPSMMHGSRARGAFVLLPSLDRILAIGGAPGVTAATTATTEVLDLSSSAPRWESSGSMHEPRRNLNAVLLPDGTVLAIGGNRGTSNYDDPVRSAESYDPSTGTWSMMAAQTAPRAYHSTAVLLPDGRVLSAGQTSGTQQTTAEIFSPPYLFSGARPTITDSPQAVGYGTTFAIDTPDADTIDDVVLIRPGSVTHSVNFDQRSVDLAYSVTPGGLSVDAPASGNIAPPGWYMAFILRDGVPSVARWIHVS